ncbi:unnamed protein product [Porites evermanni]|uniref:Uncharacterized protein n=1 Tax=Porites evermanni TaxID=104178 RepID=A0ABN8S1T6_9CNID|nr:unnamed protein product [Porites evermanni]
MLGPNAVLLNLRPFLRAVQGIRGLSYTGGYGRSGANGLKCPLENPVKKGNKKDVYTNFLNHVKQFQDIDSLPVIVKFGCDETAENWEFHRASWHKSCYAKFSSCKLERGKLTRKRNSE